MNNFVAWVSSEVAAISAFLVAFLAMLPQFGVDISAQQGGSIIAVVSIALGFFTRSKVTSEKGLAEHDEKRDALIGEYLKTQASNQ